MKNVEKIIHQDETLAIIIRKDFGEEGANFLSEPNDPFQLGVIKYPEGHEIRPHLHNKIEKSNDLNQEFVYVISGELKIDFYFEKELVQSVILNPGDSFLQLKGGHGFKMCKDTKIIELKQGPFHGTEVEKTYLD